MKVHDFCQSKKEPCRTPLGTDAECFQRAADQFPRARWEPANDNLGILSGETAVLPCLTWDCELVSGTGFDQSDVRCKRTR
jgi:hypothetical protein